MIEIKDTKGNKAYGISDNGICLQVHQWTEGGEIKRGKYKGGVSEAKWKPLECYPHNLSGALTRILDFAIVDEVALDKDIKQFIKTIDKWYEELRSIGENQ